MDDDKMPQRITKWLKEMGERIKLRRMDVSKETHYKINVHLEKLHLSYELRWRGWG